MTNHLHERIFTFPELFFSYNTSKKGVPYSPPKKNKLGANQLPIKTPYVLSARTLVETKRLKAGSKSPDIFLYTSSKRQGLGNPLELDGWKTIAFWVLVSFKG